jgi:hypothetical protein
MAKFKVTLQVSGPNEVSIGDVEAFFQQAVDDWNETVFDTPMIYPRWIPVSVILLPRRHRRQKEAKDIPDVGNEEMPNVSVTIKGIDIPLYKMKNEKIQDFVKKILRLMFNNELLPDAEIYRMLDKNYCYKTFGIVFPIIQNDEDELCDNAGHSRYWLKEKFVDEYYACSQWQLGKEPIYQSKLANWIQWIREINTV